MRASRSAHPVNSIAWYPSWPAGHTAGAPTSLSGSPCRGSVTRDCLIFSSGTEEGAGGSAEQDPLPQQGEACASLYLPL
jgi:hypothetical protein